MKKKILFNRRQCFILAASLLITIPSRAPAKKSFANIHVVKDPGCGCCDAWIQILKEAGFNVSTENRSNRLLAQFKIEKKIPKDMVACHTALVGKYFIEGHVPVKEIKHLITKNIDALGLSVPGMPYGSPGMGPEKDREAYEVFIIKPDGTSEVFTRYHQSGKLV